MPRMEELYSLPYNGNNRQNRYVRPGLQQTRDDYLMKLSTEEVHAHYWLEKMYACGPLESITSPQTLAGIHSYFIQCAQSGNLGAIDRLLESVVASRVSITWMISLLRGNFRVHEMLPNWKPFRDRVYSEIEKRGENPRVILRGLLDGQLSAPSGALDNLLGVHPTLRK